MLVARPSTAVSFITIRSNFERKVPKDRNIRLRAKKKSMTLPAIAATGMKAFSLGSHHPNRHCENERYGAESRNNPCRLSAVIIQQHILGGRRYLLASKIFSLRIWGRR